jgi:hypothetical protein
MTDVNSLNKSIMRTPVFLSENQATELKKLFSYFKNDDDQMLLETTEDAIDILYEIAIKLRKECFEVYSKYCFSDFDSVQEIIAIADIKKNEIDECFHCVPWVYHNSWVDFTKNNKADSIFLSLESIDKLNKTMNWLSSLDRKQWSNINGFHVIHFPDKGKSVSLTCQISEYVYTFESSGFLKVGKTSTLQRIKTHKTSNPDIRNIKMYRVFKNEEAEKMIHQHFEEKRTHLEFFNIDSKEVENFINEYFHVIEKLDFEQ